MRIPRQIPRWAPPMLGLVIALSLTLIAGENPFHVAMILFKSAFGSNYDLGLTLFYTTPLIFTGLSVAVAFQGGLFNIGAEGQLLMAAGAAAGVGVLAPHLPPVLAPLIALGAALCMGGLWGAIAGWLKARRGTHEVIVTILLNFIAAGLTSWWVLEIIPNPHSQNPESAIVAPAFQFKTWDPLARFFPDTGLSLAFALALFAAFAVWIAINRTVWGFEVRSVGANHEAAARSGIPVSRRQIQAMFVAGLLSAGVAFTEVLGHSGQFKIGFSPEYGFIGIAVALLAANRPGGIVLAAFLLGALHKGASELDLETETITRDFSKVIQALIIAAVGIRLSTRKFAPPAEDQP